jgi:ElaB/YqjD/DUF883 family membrane-anchored ribosome-binding protein
MQAMDEASQQEGLANQASGKVQDAASLAQEKASELREQGTARLRDQLDRRSTQTGTQMRSFAEALRRSGRETADGNGSVAQLSDQAAERLDRAGAYLEEMDGNELMRDAERFARRRPWMLAGIGMFVGIAAARFLKASSEQRYDEYRRTTSQWPVRSGVRGPEGDYAPRTEADRAGTSDPYSEPYAAAR